MMSGVCNTKNYIELMGFGHAEAIDGSGGNLSVYYLGTLIWALDGGWTIALGAAWGSRATTESAPPTGRGQFSAIEVTPRCGSVLARMVNLFVFSWMSHLIISSGLSFIDQDASPTQWRFLIAFQIILLVVLFVASILAEAEFQDIRSVSQLEKKAGNRTFYWSMLTGRGSGDLDTGRRVQLVI
ncbi:hexose carrier protein [Hyaloscypha sp. PMI_1271]|nr:hexose carrier protein [Hyaloscypha sp. PMI_1271]